MTGAVDFHLSSTPLESGVTLLEASAGTGKTFTISGIVARLVAVDDLAVGQILVVTFTEAATRELRDRIRKRLGDIDRELGAIEDGREARDPVTAALLASRIDVQTLRRRLRLALAAFDEASISTIHGFCQQLLRDNAFEGDMPFDTDVLTDPSGLHLDLAYDFWRRELTDIDPVTAALAHEHDLGPIALAALLKKISSHPELRILPESSCSLPAATEAVVSTCRTALDAWTAEGLRILELMRGHPGLSQSKAKGFLAEKLAATQRALDDAAASRIMTGAAIDALRSLASSSIDALRLKKSKERYPDDPFHQVCEAFHETCLHWVNALRVAWFRFIEKELPALKAARRVMTFDDMLLRTRAALQGPQGHTLVKVVRQRWRAALIDEFQDTDPLQYEIFHRCFSTSPHRLMLIGDPKQSIYGFRGADLHTYLSARSAIERQGGPRLYTLRRNYRSTAKLVEAVNGIFSHNPQCFMQSGMAFLPAQGDGKTANEAPLSRDGTEAGPPLTFVSVTTVATGTHDSADPSPKADHARQLIARDIAIEITTLLDGRSRLGSRSLAASDIAVLVRTHKEAVIVQEALRDAHITSVRRTGDSVFNSIEADELARILEAILEPGRGRLLRTALTAACFALSAADIVALDTNETARAEWITKFAMLRDRWHRHGFSSAFRGLLATFNLRQKLISQRGGERALTNYLHLAELIHQVERDQRLAPTSVVRWIRNQQADEATPADELLQRLERDDDAVRIVTVHNAKGLEYPIVFCPMHWQKPYVPDVLFHDTAQDGRLTLDLSDVPADAHEALAKQEKLAEDVRLLYVSLTRAVQRCYLYLHTAKNIGESALKQTLGADLQATCRQLVDDHPQLYAFRSLHREIPPAEAERSPAAAPPILAALPIARPVLHEPMVGSFSRLVAGAAEEIAQDHDEWVDDPDLIETTVQTSSRSEGDEALIFELTAGAATGVALHAVLEQVDFTDLGQLRPLVDQHFASLDLGEDMRAAITHQLERLVDHPLQADGHTLRLRSVHKSDRKSEQEFFYTLRKFSVTELAAACRPEISSLKTHQIDRLRFDPVDGYLRGFIDAIFRHDGRYYLADWKSNLLGKTTADYEPQQLAKVMSTHFYDLQSWLYAVALDRHLRDRLPDYRYEIHFGGIFYIFVRGLDPLHPQRGVHFERPTESFLRRLAETIFPMEGGAP